jgi:hypothetical protein
MSLINVRSRFSDWISNWLTLGAASLKSMYPRGRRAQVPWFRLAESERNMVPTALTVAGLFGLPLQPEYAK